MFRAAQSNPLDDAVGKSSRNAGALNRIALGGHL